MTAILDPLCCGYAKIAIYQLSVKFVDYAPGSRVFRNSKSLKAGFEEFCRMFNSCKQFEKVTYTWYKRSVTKVKKLLQDFGKNKSAEKKKLMEGFGGQRWSVVRDRTSHSLFDCEECVKKNTSLLSLFPINENNVAYILKAEAAGLRKGTKEEAIEAAHEKIKELDKEFKKDFVCSFKEAVGIDGVSKRRVKRKIQRETKKDIEAQWKETSLLRFGKNCDFTSQILDLKKVSYCVFLGGHKKIILFTPPVYPRLIFIKQNKS